MERDKAQGLEQKSVDNKYGDGVAWCRGAKIGKGSFGSVYLASLKKPRSKYSYLPPLLAVKSAEVSLSGTIQKEREVLSNIKDCPYIIGCFGEETTIGADGAMVYNLLLEYGSGGTLADKIKKSGGNGLPEFEVRCYTRSILRGLYYIHEIGYVHCDIKPENILLVPSVIGESTEFKAKIGDFGLAKRAKQFKKRKLEPYWRGTPMYLSPEAVLDNVQEPPADIWALGCIVLEMLTGKPPWGEKSDMTADDILRKIGEGHELPKIPDELSKEAKEFLKGCFVRKDRFRLTAEMLLNNSFMQDLVDEDGIEESGEIYDLNQFDSILLVSETNEELNGAFFSDGWGSMSEEDVISYYSEDDVEDTENKMVSNFSAEHKLGEDKAGGDMNSSIDAALDHAIKAAMQVSSQVPSENRGKGPFSFTIRAGV